MRTRAALAAAVVVTAANAAHGAAAPAAVLVKYFSGGGFPPADAVKTDTILQIRSDRRAELTLRSTTTQHIRFRVAPALFAQLRRAVAATPWRRLKHRYGRAMPGDNFQAVTRGGTRVRVGRAANPPATLTRVLTLLEQIAAPYGG